ncbi:MAG: peptidylprolyl isomerase [Geobacter sp.]|nr:MAG: peptidylprolyl isomerase [Geobacter sp.]
MKFPTSLATSALCTMLAATMLQGGSAFGAEAKETQSAPAKQESTARKSPNDIVVKVNGEAITRGEVDRAMKVLLSQRQMSIDQLPPEVRTQAEDATVEQLISAELLYQAGKKVEDKGIDKQVEEKIAQSRAKFAKPEEFAAALKSADLDEAELRTLTLKDLVINNYIEKEIATKVTITDADTKKFYDDNQDKFKQSESVRASHILCGVDDKAGPEAKQKAREKAEALLKKIKAGEDFASLAKSDSTCPSSKQGGDLGFFGHGQMVKPFEDAAFALKPGEVSGVVETQFGYHIIKLTEKKAAETLKYEDVKDKISEYLKNQKIQKDIESLLKDLRGKAKIEKI